MALIDAAVMWPNGKAYFFSGSDYYRYDVAADRVDPGFPQPIAANWRGLGGVRIEAAVAWPNGKAYFFSGSDYYRYDIAADRVDPGFPQPIKTNWPGLLIFRSTNINAATIWPNGFAYFFSGDQYYKWNVVKDRIEPNYPQPIQQNWSGLWSSPPFFNAALVWPPAGDGSQKAYFFQHTLYMRYDVATDRVDPNFPQPISPNWRGL